MEDLEYEYTLKEEPQIDYEQTKKLNDNITLCFVVYPEEDEAKNDGYIFKINNEFYHTMKTFDGNFKSHKVNDLHHMGCTVPLIYPTDKVLPEARQFAIELIKFIQKQKSEGK